MSSLLLLVTVAALIPLTATAQESYTAYLLSDPLGAQVYQSGQKKSLGRTPISVAVPISAVDPKPGSLVRVEYEARWRSGAISRLVTFVGIVSPNELIFTISRPSAVPGLEKDKAVEAAHIKNPLVASEIQLLLAKHQQMQASLAAHAKEQDRLAEQRKEQEALESYKAEQQERSVQLEKLQQERLAQMKKAEEDRVRQQEVKRRRALSEAMSGGIVDPNSNNPFGALGNRYNDSLRRQQ